MSQSLVLGDDLAQRPLDALHRIAYAGDDRLVLRRVSRELDALQRVAHVMIQIADHLESLGDVLAPLARALDHLHSHPSRSKTGDSVPRHQDFAGSLRVLGQLLYQHGRSEHGQPNSAGHRAQFGPRSAVDPRLRTSWFRFSRLRVRSRRASHPLESLQVAAAAAIGHWSYVPSGNASRATSQMRNAHQTSLRLEFRRCPLTTKAGSFGRSPIAATAK